MLNLQYFHRDDRTTHPPLPALSRDLVWPRIAQDDDFGPGSAVCDNATRLSRRGACTWWHLDDCGEFVEQTGLATPAHKDNTQPVKVFVYGPRGSYDWFIHDVAAEEAGKVAGLHLFETPDEDLPPAQFMPILTVAILKAGGRALVSPPNIPHLVVSVNDCVMVEQRRVVLAHLDEVAYFLQKCRKWTRNPVIYGYVQDELHKDEVVQPMIRALFQRMDAAKAAGDGVLFKRYGMSLLAIARFPEYFQLHGGEDGTQAIVREVIGRGMPMDAAIELDSYTDTVDSSRWCMDEGGAPTNVFYLGENAYAQVQHRDGCRPVWGPVRPTVAAAQQTPPLLNRPAKPTPTASGADDVLDELF